MTVTRCIPNRVKSIDAAEELMQGGSSVNLENFPAIPEFQSRFSPSGPSPALRGSNHSQKGQVGWSICDAGGGHCRNLQVRGGTRIGAQ